MDLYPVFADWAKGHGLDGAIARFASQIPAETVEHWAEMWRSDLIKVQNGGPAVIAAGLPDWYSGPGAFDLFWPSLRRQFIALDWPEDRVKGVDDSSTRVVAHTPRPDSKSFGCRGLVVGYVQSGKTTNFTSVIAKLADEDYRFVIVLSGIHNGLRKQTQQRLDEQLKNLNPDHWFTLTDEERDFHPPSAAPAAYLTAGNKIVLAVIKKNPVVLRRLIKWLDTKNGRQALAQTNVAVIDDEADQASVATGRINPLIRGLLGLLPRCTYIGYTATPFANVFIDPAAEDLYPKDFILNLPKPEGYFGPEVVFGRDAVDEDDSGSDGFDMVRRVPDTDVALLRPVGKGSDVGFAPTMTAGLVDAVRWFWLATAARRARGHLTGHSTMLIHTSVKTSVHESFRAPLLDLKREAMAEIAGGNLPAHWARLWEQEIERVRADNWHRRQNTFDEVRAHLATVVEATRVVLDNSRSDDRLNYTDVPVVAIAVGGNTLSRGLTLEGLVSSLFVRGASAYDTLLQMGRWFGYRTGYEDLPRIWTTQDLEASFRHLAQVEHEMRLDIESYQLQNRTPMEVAVRIRTHPSLQITAKMGAAQPAYVSYAGRRLQTRYFKRIDEAWLGENLSSTERLLATAQRYAEPEDRVSHILFRDVPVDDIRAFLSSYQVHEDSPDMDRRMLLKYIDKQLGADHPSLERWNVALVQGTGTLTQLAGLAVRASIRSRVKGANGDAEERADIKTLMSPQDLVLDLDIDAAAAKALGEAKLKEVRSQAEAAKDRGLVVLYAIDQLSQPGEVRRKTREALNAVGTVIGLGLVFPGDADDRTRIQASHVAVDLSLVERVDLDEYLNQDLEDGEP